MVGKEGVMRRRGEQVEEEEEEEKYGWSGKGGKDEKRMSEWGKSRGGGRRWVGDEED